MTPRERRSTCPAHGSRRGAVARALPGWGGGRPPPRGVAFGDEPERVALRLHAAHEIVEREVVQHDQPRRVAREAVEVAVEAHGVPERGDAEPGTGHAA